MTADQEYRMIEELKTGACSVERALLVVSGLDEEGIRTYQRRLDSMQRDLERHLQRQGQEGNAYQRAAGLFSYIWESQKAIYSKKYFLLTKVIDNHFRRSDRVGSCLGLTSLYSVAGLRLGLDLAVLSDVDHTLNILAYEGREVVIENTSPKGFDYSQKRTEKFQRHDLPSLVAFALTSRGKKRSLAGDYKRAIQDYNKALQLEPNDGSSFNNRGLAHEKLGELDSAASDYLKALDLMPDRTIPWKNLLELAPKVQVIELP